MFGQIARKVEEIATGTPPERITGSTTVRLAVGLITGKRLTDAEIADRDAWEMLDGVQRKAVVQLRPASKFAAWLIADLELEPRAAIERPQKVSAIVRRLRSKIERSKVERYVIHIELREPQSRALALFCERSSVDRLRQFAENDEQARQMQTAIEELRSSLRAAGLAYLTRD